MKALRRLAGACIALALSLPAQVTDLGGGLAGVDGIPQLSASGTFQVGDVVTINLDNSEILRPAALVLGLSVINFPILGGVFVPSPDVSLNLSTDAQGRFEFQYVQPNPITYVVQAFVMDPSAVEGLSFSNALQFTVAWPAQYTQSEARDAGDSDVLSVFLPAGSSIDAVKMFCPPSTTSAIPSGPTDSLWDGSDATDYTRVSSSTPLSEGSNTYHLDTGSGGTVTVTFSMPTGHTNLLGKLIRVCASNVAPGHDVDADWVDNAQGN